VKEGPIPPGNAPAYNNEPPPKKIEKSKNNFGSRECLPSNHACTRKRLKF